MNYLYIFIPLIIIGLVITAIMIILNKRKRKKETPVLKTEVKPLPYQTDMDHPQIVIKSNDHKLYEKFISEYDDGSLNFNNLDYRRGAKNTCKFGISNGFKKDGKGNLEWGWVRLHTGDDRANGGHKILTDGTRVDDVVISPFNFHRTSLVDYGNTSYGTLISLWQDEYQFEMRIAHLDPRPQSRDFTPFAWHRINQGLAYGRDWAIGKTGNYGDSTGAHTHTEFKSQDEKCEVFEILLEEKFGEKALKEYTSAEVIREFKKYDKFKNASNAFILKEWQEVKKHRGAFFANKYMYRYVDFDGSIKTRYSGGYLFNGL